MPHGNEGFVLGRGDSGSGFLYVLDTVKVRSPCHNNNSVAVHWEVRVLLPSFVCSSTTDFLNHTKSPALKSDVMVIDVA